MAERRLDALTATRFFACLVVVLFHFGFRAVAKIPVLREVVHVGYLGVSFFFVLSGFVLAAVYAPRIGGLRPRVFYIARFARIVPVYALALLCSLVPYAAHLRQTLPPEAFARSAGTTLALRATLLSAWIPGYALELNGPAWTLSVEAFFYAAFPFVLAWAVRAPDRVRRTAFLSFLAVGLLVPFAIHHLAPSAANASLDRTANYFPLFHLGSFLMGVEAGLAYVRGTLRGDRRLGRAAGLSVLLVALAVAFAPHLPAELLQCGLLAIPFALLALWVAENDARLAFLCWAPLVLLGEASYAAYILQEPMGFFVAWWFGHARRPGLVGSGVGILTHLGLLEIVAVLVHGLLERPARAWLRSRLEPKGSREARTVASGVLVSESPDARS